MIDGMFVSLSLKTWPITSADMLLKCVRCPLEHRLPSPCTLDYIEALAADHMRDAHFG